jgi:hypothetical protein
VRAPALLLTIALAASPAVAQSPSFGLASGASIGLGALGRAYPIGPHLAASVRLRPISQLAFLSVQAEAAWHHLRAGDDPLLGDGAVTLWTVGAALVADVPVAAGSRYRPYVITGVGVARRPAISGLGLAYTAGEWSGGLGVDVQLGAVRLFSEMRYRRVWLSGPDEELLPLTIGLRLAGR